MNIDKMSNDNREMCLKLYEVERINYGEIQTSVANHLDFVKLGKGWVDIFGNDIVGLKRVGFRMSDNREDMYIFTPNGNWLLPLEIWKPDFADEKLNDKLKGALVEMVSLDIRRGYSTLFNMGEDGERRAIISNRGIWTMMEKEDEYEKWIELYDNDRHGYILEPGSFSEAFKRK